ncbi:hypothetical protein Cni_G02031 [Canna indica]|uniref:WW domain-containing protein n=1 Tax=Canna indica TaxID=4628 RepID=A0AAQ3JNG8_9LILI|nr:hypothetical protein Cni_G02031 [Canna indica]
MVSLHAALSQEKNRESFPNLENLVSRKRKNRDGEDDHESNNLLAKELKLTKAEKEEEDTVELNLDAPLPLEWQRCLDIKSGQIHFYNTMTQRRTSRDPRLNEDLEVGLDLELNLAYDPPPTSENFRGGREERSIINSTMKGMPPLLQLPDEEMVAGVCMRCHILVMMSKVALSCPNCKFVQPPDQRSFSCLSKPGFKLLCCKD